MKITEPIVLIPPRPDGTTGAALTAKPTSMGFVAVDLGPDADPVAMTPEVIAAERAGLPSWRFRKEYLRDFGAQAGMPVFATEWLDAQAKNVKPPVYRMAWNRETGTLAVSPDGEIRCWYRPNTQPDDLPFGGRFVRACGIGVDVGEGVGASDSTIQVFFADNREQVAEFASNTIKPTDLGRLCVAIARYYYNALICCVRKMHGISVLRAMLDDCGYQNLWRAKVSDRIMEYDAANFGWAGGEASSPYLFGPWTDAIQHGNVTLHSQTTLDQHRQYIYDLNGRITHQARADMPPEVRERHGDLVIACALAYRSCLDAHGTTGMGSGRAWPERKGWAL